jgi:hypothetical protein
MNSKYLAPFKYIFLLFCTFLFTDIEAQVFPGDANNNGKVDNVDILYMGYAFGTVGPMRLEDLEIFPEWPFEFPDGTNYAFADANGDGIIDEGDLLEIFVNYNEENENVEPTDDVFALGSPDFDPEIQLTEPDLEEPLTQGGFFEIPISLGSEDHPIENFNGLAFTIEYDPDFVQFIDMNFTAEWMDFDEENTAELFAFQSLVGDTNEGELDVAFSRFGLDPITGWGEIGVLSIVIEDDLIGLLPADSANIIVKLKEVKLINGQFTDIPVVHDSLSVMVYHPDAITNTDEPPLAQAINTFPNPVQNDLHIHSPVAIERLELYNLLGQLSFSQNYEGDKFIELDTKDLDTGIYTLKVYTREGQISRKITIQKK